MHTDRMHIFAKLETAETSDHDIVREEESLTKMGIGVTGYMPGNFGSVVVKSPGGDMTCRMRTQTASVGFCLLS